MVDRGGAARDLAGPARRALLADRLAAGERAHPGLAPRGQPRPDRAQPPVAAAVLDPRRRRARVRGAAGARGGDWIRDHLVAGLAPAGIGGDRDRGARRRALLRREDLATEADPADPDARLPL